MESQAANAQDHVRLMSAQQKGQARPDYYVQPVQVLMIANASFVHDVLVLFGECKLSPCSYQVDSSPSSGCE